MAESTAEQFKDQRERLHKIVMKYAGLGIKRFHGLDKQVYRAGALSAPAKELLGLVASLVLRCDDCVRYHIIRCHEEGTPSDQLEEALAIAVVVGGSVTIPHLHRALALWDQLQASGGRSAGGSG
jgi:AhpD family alkylhydroperoxidase